MHDFQTETTSPWNRGYDERLLFFHQLSIYFPVDNHSIQVAGAGKSLQREVNLPLNDNWKANRQEKKSMHQVASERELNRLFTVASFADRLAGF